MRPAKKIDEQKKLPGECLKRFPMRHGFRIEALFFGMRIAFLVQEITMLETNSLGHQGLLENENEDSQKDKYLTFHIEGEDYALDIRYVTEIVGVQKITTVPEMSADIKGVINLRGKIIPLMDVRLRFHLPGRDYDDRTCVIVVRVGEASVGLVVDTVSDVLDIPAARIEPVSNIHRKKENDYIRGIGRSGEEMKIVLDLEKLLFNRPDLEKAVRTASFV